MLDPRLACALACLLIPALPRSQGKPAKAAKATGAKATGAKATGSKAEAPRQKVLLVRPTGAYADLPGGGVDPMALLMGEGGKQSAFYEFADRIASLANEKGDEPIFFDLTRSFGFNGAQLREIERRMSKLRAAGKKTIAYLENASSSQYQLAALCEQVCLAGMGGVEISSPSMSVMFMKDALDLVGVRLDIVRCGDFKGAVEPYLLPRMSDHLREHYVAMLTKINNDVVRRIAKARRIDPATVRSLQAKRLLSAKEALAAGLVDRIVPWDGAERTLGRILGTKDYDLVDALGKKKKRGSAGFLSVMNDLFAPKRKRTKKLVKDTVAVLHLSGGIVDGDSGGGGSMVSGPTVKAIDRLAKDDKVKGVVARINSPGGSATASEAIRRALDRLAAKKPLVFSMGRVAASGGYWITCIGRPIYAEAATITGSIGVFAMKPSLGTLMRRVGVHEELIGLDQGAQFLSLSASWNESLRARMQTRVNDIYDKFLAIAAKSRGMAKKDVAAVAGGRVWSGEQAKARGLIDTVGGLGAAIAQVAKEAKIEDFATIHRPQPGGIDSFLSQLFAQGGVLGDPKTRMALSRLGNLDTVLAVLFDSFRNHGPARVWAVTNAVVGLR